jgi:hypothetical protein
MPKAAVSNSKIGPSDLHPASLRIVLGPKNNSRAAPWVKIAALITRSELQNPEWLQFVNLSRGALILERWPILCVTNYLTLSRIASKHFAQILKIFCKLASILIERLSVKP